jgi:Fe-S cluster assembly iron-binding protein IscA
MGNFQEKKKQIEERANEIVKEYGCRDLYVRLAIHKAICAGYSIAMKEKDEVKS